MESMKLAFTTVDLYPGREWLMPWRTVIEVCMRMRARGIDAQVINLPVAAPADDYTFDYPDGESIDIKSAPRDFSAFGRMMESEGYDVVIYPTPWREALKGSFKAMAGMKCKKIAYIPGGVYSVSDCITLARWSGISVAKPYLIDALTPDRKLAGMLNDCGFESVVGLTPYTAEVLQKAGCKNAVDIVTAKDGFCELEAQEIKVDLPDRFLLFSGAPAPTRGAKQILQALDKVKHTDMRVVMLMRTDVGSDYEALENAYRKMVHKERVVMLRQKVTREQLRWIFEKAWYAMLPFVVVPSEVPVTYLEVMSCGTPVITFDNGGTTRLLKDGLLIANKSVDGLAKAMDKAWEDVELHDKLSANALHMMKEYPTWDEVADQWIKLI